MAVESTINISDDILVKKSQAGDYLAFEELVKRYEKKIYNIAYRIMGNQDDASDILQETFIQALRKIKSFKGNSNYSTWLYRIAVNQCLMRKRKDKQTPTVSLDVPVLTKNDDEVKREFSEDWSKNPVAKLENKEIRNTLTKAIDSLPEEYRNVIILRGVNELSNEEIAKILKISVPAVKSRLHRARLYLQENLSRYFKGTGSGI